MSERYMMGACHHFAVAMHRLTGWDLALVAGPMSGREAVLHVFCLAPDGLAWDVRGDHALDDIMGEQVAARGREAWPVRLDGEAAVWRLSAGAGALLNPIHDTFVLDAIDAVEDVLDGAAPIVSDGWKPRDAAAVEEARKGGMPMPSIGREAAMEPQAAPAP